MDIVLHWKITKNNFVNKERGLSSKHRLGHKAGKLEQRTTLSIHRERLDLRFKKQVETALIKNSPFIRKDLKCSVIINNTVYYLNARNPKEFSNRLTNILIEAKQPKKDVSTYLLIKK